jgi:hypothetical protein
MTAGISDDVFVVTAGSNPSYTSATATAAAMMMATTVITSQTDLTFANSVDIITGLKSAVSGTNTLDVSETGGVTPTSLEGANLGNALWQGVYVAYGELNGGVFDVAAASTYNSISANDALVLVSDGSSPLNSSGWIVMKDLTSALGARDFVRPPSRVHADLFCPVCAAEPLYLDLGCAAGHTILALAPLYPKVCFVGVDLNPHHIQQAQAEATRLHLTNTRFLEVDVRALPAVLPAAHITVVRSHGGTPGGPGRAAPSCRRGQWR